jgi:electron transfer flavoprotein alpha subunit
MGVRIVVAAAGLSDLQRMADAARRLAGTDGQVQAVALEGDDGLLAPGDCSLDEATAGLADLADLVLVYEDCGSWLRGDVWAAALAEALADDARGLFLADSPLAREAAGRVAAVCGASCASMCEEVGWAPDGGLAATRSVYGGVAEAVLSLTTQPAVCLFAKGSFAGARGGRAITAERRRTGPPRHEMTRVGDEPVVKTVDLAGASIVVSVGRGFAKAEDIAIVDPLLQQLGAELGCSRPVAEDFRWLPKERLVGLTGTSVNADLYRALGISGQVQHLTGIKNARVVVAVNSDAKAPITRNADYVITGDLYKVVPALVAALGGTTAAGSAS